MEKEVKALKLEELERRFVPREVGKRGSNSLIDQLVDWVRSKNVVC